jgi:hypothetical protein
MPTPGESQGPEPRGSQALISGVTHVPLARESQGSNLEESQMPHEGDFTMLGPDQLAPRICFQMTISSLSRGRGWRGAYRRPRDPAHTD